MKQKTNARLVRDFNRAQRRVDHLDAVVARLQQLRRHRNSIISWWGAFRSRRLINMAIDARDDLIVYRRAARRRGLLNHRT